MAKRPIFIPELEEKNNYVKTFLIDFDWVKGMAFSQRQKCVDSLHKAAKNNHGFNNLLEISSKSRIKLGVQLSAFNLMIVTPKKNTTFSVECAYQSGKVFENGGPFLEILKLSSKEAKKFFKQKQNLGNITAFQSNNFIWPIYPTTMFYDWIYINALSRQQTLTEEVIKYNAFSDIEFNPLKSKNCQAYAVALYLSLLKRNLLKKALSSPNEFIKLINNSVINTAHENQCIQPNIL